jgi:multiple sugar transport system substrate-binding protein
MKRRLSIVLLLTMLLATACQKGSPTRAVQIQAQPDSVPEIITIDIGAPAKGVPILDQLITAFEARYAQYRVRKVDLPPVGPNFLADLEKRLRAGEYDLFPVLSDDRPIWASLDPYLDRSRPAMDRVAKAAESLRQGGTVYRLPILLEPECFLVNRGMWEAAGLTLPAQGWDWDAFRSAAAKLTSGQDTARVWGSGVNIPEYLFSVWLMQKTGEEFWLADEQDLREGLQFFTTMVQTDRSLPEPQPRDWGNGTSLSPYATLFYEEKAAIGYGTFLPLVQMQQWVKFPWDVLPVPTRAGGKPVMRVTPYSYAISSASPDKDAAWAFLQFAVGPEGAAIVAANGAVPTDGSAVTQDAWKGIQPAPPAGMAYLLKTPWVIDAINGGSADERMIHELYRLTNLSLRGEIAPDTAVTQYLEFRQKRVAN